MSSKPLRLRLAKFVDRELFNKYHALCLMIGTYDPDTKSWVLKGDDEISRKSDEVCKQLYILDILPLADRSVVDYLKSICDPSSQRNPVNFQGPPKDPGPVSDSAFAKSMSSSSSSPQYQQHAIATVNKGHQGGSSSSSSAESEVPPSKIPSSTYKVDNDDVTTAGLTKTMEVHISGNYVYLLNVRLYPSLYVDLTKDLTIIRRQWNRDSNQYDFSPISLYFENGNKFTTYRGLYPIVKENLIKHGMKPVVYLPSDKRRIVDPILDILKHFDDYMDEVEDYFAGHGITLRGYQLEAIKRSLRHMVSHLGFLIQIPTGAGKTITFLAMLRLLTTHQAISRPLVVVGMGDLLRQWYQESRKYVGDLYHDIGLLDQDNKHVVPSSFNIATYQSINARLSPTAHMPDHLVASNNDVDVMVKDADLVLVDEVHHLPADSLKTILKLNTNIHGGLSATPFREDDLHLLLYGYTSTPSISLKLSDVQFVQNHWLTPIRVYNVEIDFLHLAPGKSKISDIITDDDLESNNFQRLMKVLLADQKLLKFAIYVAGKMNQVTSLPSVIHVPLEKIAKLISDTYDVPILSGKVKGSRRSVVLTDLKGNNVPVAVSTTVLDEGVDIPALGTLIELIPGASRVKLIQRIGRLTRVYQNKGYGNAMLFHYKTDNPYLNDLLLRQKRKRDEFLKDYGIPVTDISWRNVESISA